ncbi:hypothetical protein ACFVIZ_00060 [Streptomyces anulatus]|uniref:hypothetical protein n=1 Tax=Streptomyces anulatus TaxID=1892 RepID=UPI00363E4093
MSNNTAEPPVIVKPEIFKTLPDPVKETFDKSVVIKESSHERLGAVLYAPDLQFIGTIENSESDASASYTKSVTEGFQIGVAVTISSELSVDVSAVVAKGTLKVGMAITFSAHYNKSTTETVSFQVPAGKKAFLYQGYIRTKILKHDPGAGTYSWDEASSGRFLTNATATYPTPQLEAAVLVEQG